MKKVNVWWSVSLVFTILAIYGTIEVSMLFSNCGYTSAKIISKEKYVMETDMYGEYYQYSFSVDSVEYISNNLHTPPRDNRYKVGDIVEIVYNKGNINDNRINDFFDTYYQFLPYYFLAIVAAFVGY